MLPKLYHLTLMPKSTWHWGVIAKDKTNRTRTTGLNDGTVTTTSVRCLKLEILIPCRCFVLYCSGRISTGVNCKPGLSQLFSPGTKPCLMSLCLQSLPVKECTRPFLRSCHFSNPTFTILRRAPTASLTPRVPQIHLPFPQLTLHCNPSTPRRPMSSQPINFLAFIKACQRTSGVSLWITASFDTVTISDAVGMRTRQSHLICGWTKHANTL